MDHRLGVEPGLKLVDACHRAVARFPVVHPGAFDLPLSPLGHAILPRVLLPGLIRLQSLLGSRPGAGPPA